MAVSSSERVRKSDLLPNLGLGGSLVSVFLASFFAAHAACVALVVLMYGPHAYFVEGLRVKDWKLGIMSTGRELPFPSHLLLGLVTFILTIALVACSEWIAGAVRSFLKRSAPWVSAVFRLLGGAALLAFSIWVYKHGAHPLHPIPFSSLIAGLVLVWKGAVSILRRSSSMGC